MAIISLLIDPHTVMKIGKMGNYSGVTIIELGKIQSVFLNGSPMFKPVDGTVK